MSAFKLVNIKAFSKPVEKLSEEDVLWKNYVNPLLIKEFGAIDYIDFSPIEPYNFIATSSTHVNIYNPNVKMEGKPLHNFKQKVYGANFRQDGKLISVGDELGSVRLFETNSKSLLRIFKGHSAAVHRTRFTGDNFHMISFSDDNTSTYWDISSEVKLHTFEGHEDYVRSGATNPVSPDIFASGGYDNKIIVYDVRQQKSIFAVNHEAPVESLMFLPSGGILISAGGNDLKVWDTLNGGKLLCKVSQHHKTITCLSQTENGQYVLSGSLDKHVKVYETSTYRIIHDFVYSNSILSVALSKNSDNVVAGSVDGLISVKKREVKDHESEENRKKIKQQKNKTNLDKQHVVSIPQYSAVAQAKYDTCLRKFEYSKALNKVMMNYVTNKKPEVTIALLHELNRRQGLHVALRDRDGKALLSVLRFVAKHIGNPRYQRVLLNVVNILLDIYGEQLFNLESDVQEMFLILTNKLQEETDFMFSLMELQGALDMIIAAS